MLTAAYGIATYGNAEYGHLILDGGAGSFALTGGDAAFLYNQVLSADAGAYALSGSDATFLYNQVISAGGWHFTYTGFDAQLAQTHILTGAAGTYALTGGNAEFQYDQLLTGDAGAYSLTGTAANLLASRILPCQSGQFAYTGNDAGLFYIQAAAEASTGGLPPKKVKTKIKKSERDDIEKIVREAFDKMDGTLVPEKVAEIKRQVANEVQYIDFTQYDIALAQTQAIIAIAQASLADYIYELEQDEEEAILLLM